MPYVQNKLISCFVFYLKVKLQSMSVQVNLLRVTGKGTMQKYRVCLKKEVKGILGCGNFLVPLIQAKHLQEGGEVVFCLQRKEW